MSPRPSGPRRGGHPGFASYMASVFSSGVRLCAHATGMAAGRLAVLAELGLATPSQLAEVRRLVQHVVEMERESSRHWAAASQAVKLGRSFEHVARHTDANLRLRRNAQLIEGHALALERTAIDARRDAAAGTAPLSARIEIWSIPAHDRAQLLRSVISPTEPALAQEVSAWAAGVEPQDQMLFRIASAGGLVLQLARPPYGREVWPWTVRLQPALGELNARGDEFLRVSQSLSEHDFVSHGDRDAMWCHVAPAAPRAFGDWVAAVAAVTE